MDVWACHSLSPFYTKLSVCLSVCLLKLAKIAALLRVEFTLEPLFAPHDTPPSLAPSSLPFAPCHQSPTVSKNSSIVIVTDSPRFARATSSSSNTGSRLACLIYSFGVFVLASPYNRYQYRGAFCSTLEIFNYLSRRPEERLKRGGKQERRRRPLDLCRAPSKPEIICFIFHAAESPHSSPR